MTFDNPKQPTYIRIEQPPPTSSWLILKKPILIANCIIPVAAESGGDFYKSYPFNVTQGGGAGTAGAGRSKSSSSSALNSVAVAVAAAAAAANASSAVAAPGTAPTTPSTATQLDEHVSRANSRRLVGRPH